VLQFQSLGTLAATLAPFARPNPASAGSDAEAAAAIGLTGPLESVRWLLLLPAAASEEAELELRLLLRLLQDWYSAWQWLQERESVPRGL